MPSKLRLILLLVLVTLTACGSAGEVVESTEMPVAAGEEPIYLAIIWHQHQPVYFKDPATGLYARPWVRVHATKDYVDMAAILEQYPEIHATYNLTPSLIRQLDDLANGAKDIYWAYAETAASELSDEQKQFILDRFFDTNREIISRFPRYQELLTKRDSSENALSAYSEQDFLDLQVLFNLAWVDPDWLAVEPLATLVEKGENFSEGDKEILFAEHLRLIQEVIPLHRRMQESGQIEVTMTPFAHPILPLLVTTQLAREALPEIELPSLPFIYGQDATAQVELGVQFYEDHFGVAPRGMWPAEGSVAQEIVTMVSQAGIQWIASDEGVLANSLGFSSFERETDETVIDAATLYQPYAVQGQRGDPVAILFRDVAISDKVGFTYSGTPGAVAATDFVGRIHDIREQVIASGAEGPHLVTVLLDGENAWEFYENDGKEFLHSLYQQLSDDPLIKTVTPSEYLALDTELPAIEELWAGSWINHDFSTWIGEEEENQAWDLLAETRAMLQTFITGDMQDAVNEEQRNLALENMYIAEGSDWFWWYGADQNSGNDDSFDQQFRSTLKSVYEALGVQTPASLEIPIIAQAAAQPDRPATALIAPSIDGQIGEDEWAGSALYSAAAGEMHLGFDAQNLYVSLAADNLQDLEKIELVLSIPGGAMASGYSSDDNVLGFAGEISVVIDTVAGSAEWYAPVTAGTWEAVSSVDTFAMGDGQIEMALPLANLGNADTGAPITVRAFYGANAAGAPIPESGPAQVVVPDLGTTTVLLEIADPEGDDHGPGTYTYPQDVVFNAGNFDILNLQIGVEEQSVVFKFEMRGPVDNAWASPNGLSLQTFDIYIDQDHDGNGGTALFPGRNLTLGEPFAWDYAIHIEGWTSGIYVPTADGIEQVFSSSEFQILTDPGQRRITIRVPKAILGDNPEAWAYAAMVMSQEGYPSGGVMRVRDVLPVAEQWRLGGAPSGGINHTRVVDLVWAEEGVQEAWLSAIPASSLAQTELTAADFATILMFLIGE
jgi:alpha-amylase/alpha-mannosidase (GH57 family)